MHNFVVAIVQWCWRHAAAVLTVTALATVAMTLYAANTLNLDTDESKLISPDLPFRKAERQIDTIFPQGTNLLVAVIDAPTPEQAEAAVDALSSRLAPHTNLFHFVRRPPEEMFFRKNGLMFLSVDELYDFSDRIVAAQPLIGTMAKDPSLRGLLSAIDLFLEGVDRGAATIQDLKPLFDTLGGAAADVAAGRKPTPVSWQNLFASDQARDTPRRFLLMQPILQYGELVPGRTASNAVRDAARALDLTPAHGIHVRLTGSVALTDANFETVSDGLAISTPIMIVSVGLLLFLAVRSFWLVGAILISMVVGLVATAAFAAVTVGTINPISVAFAVMFVGIAVDFGIQYIVRYRDDLYRHTRPDEAMRHCARHMAAPLSLAALSAAVGFLSFLPTAYTGVSQLGLIAGAGMIIALVIDFTVLPALMALRPPRPEKAPVGLHLEAADRWLASHRRPVVYGALLLAALGAALLPVLPVDFNPLHLQNPKAEAVSTLLDLASDPDSGTYSIDVLTPSLKAADAMADRLDPLPEVRRTMTLDTFVPDHQTEKRAILADLSSLLAPTLAPLSVEPPPSPALLVQSLRDTAARLAKFADKDKAAATLAETLRKAAERGPDAAQALQSALTSGVGAQLRGLQRMLTVEPITLASLPADLVANWVGPDGQAKVQVSPKGNMEERKQLLRFVEAVRAIAPNATGTPVAIEQSGKMVLDAFSGAGLTALVAIFLLLFAILRRALDAFLVMLPLIMGSLYTAIGVIILGIPLNFANIIALPLLLGIGVAFNIYFVVNWRQGVTEHLSSATTRAVLFSALTTACAFGSLAVSPHLGTASMGLLLFLSLGLSVITTFVFLPALFSLMGRRPR